VRNSVYRSPCEGRRWLFPVISVITAVRRLRTRSWTWPQTKHFDIEREQGRGSKKHPSLVGIPPEDHLCSTEHIDQLLRLLVIRDADSALAMPLAGKPECLTSVPDPEGVAVVDASQPSSLFGPGSPMGGPCHGRVHLRVNSMPGSSNLFGV